MGAYYLVLVDWGYLSWERVESFCREHGLANTLRVFDSNRGQIH
jgi:hypothetical protein